ncbi:CLC14 protein, partial [Rhinopomastus cyanomelas]|nr:CLC14 protein [Rhinopomastus cyanomelas]
ACAPSRAGPPRSAVRCQPGGSCFSAHLANSSYDEARGACSRRQAGLAWVGSNAELLLLRALLEEALAAGPGPPALLWVGLRRNAPACTDVGQPLRGFSWEGSGDGAAPREVPRALGRWVKEPVKSCIASRCAGLRAAAAPPGESGAGWGWQE